MEDFITIKIVEQPSSIPSNESSIINIGKKTLGSNITFKIKKVTKIDRGQDRKFHVVISKLHLKN